MWNRRVYLYSLGLGPMWLGTCHFFEIIITLPVIIFLIKHNLCVGGWWSGAPTLTYDRYIRSHIIHLVYLMWYYAWYIHTFLSSTANSYQKLKRSSQKKQILLWHARRDWGELLFNELNFQIVAYYTTLTTNPYRRKDSCNFAYCLT